MKIYPTGLRHIDDARVAIDQDLDVFIRQWQQTYDQGSRAAIDAYCQIVLRGGKRLRGILAMQSYYAHGGTDPAVALGAARVLELVQAYLLVLDDIADRSDTRRGGPSAHQLVIESAKTEGITGDLLHYGEAQATNAAQCGMHRAALELLQLPVADSVIRHALASLHKNIEITGIGQINDLYNEATSNPLDEAAIERVLTQKSAYYTVVNPLELGACLAGEAQLDKYLRTYALHTGCAFQITDDLIGTFGAQAATGKSVNDDIREGKMTLLAQHALSHASPDDRHRLRQILGNNNASQADCDTARDIMQAVGAREYAQQRVAWYRQQAHQALDLLSPEYDMQFVSFLGDVTDYVATRQS